MAHSRSSSFSKQSLDGDQRALSPTRQSLEAERRSMNGSPLAFLVNGINGKSSRAPGDGNEPLGAEQLQQELEKTRDEKDIRRRIQCAVHTNETTRAGYGLRPFLRMARLEILI